ncbi:liprin-beta-1 [Anopheles marshallii]|uniref:liprin-beta-1 n=1 Tax=Anopheles marshallii TaxID=1521116 RepID=UPI00237C1982|nr:liprin-beta-1 [Anopheles marshallii]
MVARAGRSRFFACLGLLIVMVGLVTMFHNSQQQLDELRQLGLRCEQQQKSVQAQMEVIVDQKLRLENSLESERMINDANRKELKQKAKEEKEEHSKTSMEANIRYASLQQQCNLVKSQLGDLTEECSRGRKQQSEEINSLRLKVSELQGKVQRYKQESANDAEHLKAQIVQLKSDKLNLEATLRRQLGEKDHVIEQMRDLATKMEKENAHYLEHCKLPAEQLPKQHHRYRDVLEALSRDNALKANAPVHSFNAQLSVSDDLYRIPVALRARHFATHPGNLFGASSTTVSIGLSPSTLSPPFATNKGSGLGVGLPQVSEEQETRVIANPFEVVPRAVDAKRSERHSPEAVPNTNPTIHPALDGGIINSVENFQIIPKPLPAEAAPEGAPANNVLQEPHLLKTSTSVSTGHKRSSDRNLQLPILAAPTVLPGPPSMEHSSKRTNNGADGGGGTLSGSSSTTSTTTNASVRKAAGAAPNRSVGSAARKPLSNRHTKQVPVGIVPFPDIMPELEQNISENILDNRYANVAAAAAGGSTGGGRPIAEAGGGASSAAMSKKAFADKQRRHGGADLNFLNGGGANAADDNGAHEVQDTEMRAKRPAAIGADGERGADNGAPAGGDDDQLAMGNENNLNAAEEDTNLYDNANDAAAVGLGNKPQFGGGDHQHHLDYNDVMVPGHGIGRHIGSKRREGPAGAGGIDSKGVIIDRMGDKLINEIAHDHGKEGDNYPNEMEDLHLVGNEAEEEDVSDYDDPTALKQGHAERN